MRTLVVNKRSKPRETGVALTSQTSWAIAFMDAMVLYSFPWRPASSLRPQTAAS